MSEKILGRIFVAAVIICAIVTVIMWVFSIYERSNLDRVAEKSVKTLEHNQKLILGKLKTIENKLKNITEDF